MDRKTGRVNRIYLNNLIHFVHGYEDEKTPTFTHEVKQIMLTWLFRVPLSLALECYNLVILAVATALHHNLVDKFHDVCLNSARHRNHFNPQFALQA